MESHLNKFHGSSHHQPEKYHVEWDEHQSIPAILWGKHGKTTVNRPTSQFADDLGTTGDFADSGFPKNKTYSLNRFPMVDFPLGKYLKNYLKQTHGL